jgi:hypothetical protein
MKLPEDPKDIKVLREFLTTVRQQICGMGDCLAEPWKTHFNNLQNEYDSFLSKLPPTEQVAAAHEAHYHLRSMCSLLCSAQSLATSLHQKLSAMENGFASQVASAADAKLATLLTSYIKVADVDGLVAKAIEGKVTAGELVTKDSVTALCSAAKQAGITEGETKVKNENEAKEKKTQLMATRRTALQTAGVPIPEGKLEEILGADDAVFDAAKKKAEARVSAMQQKGIPLNSILVFLPSFRFLVRVPV